MIHIIFTGRFPMRSRTMFAKAPSKSLGAEPRQSYYILTTSTLARSNTLCVTVLADFSSSDKIRGCNEIWEYVPAALRLESWPGLMTITLSTTCNIKSVPICSEYNEWAPYLDRRGQYARQDQHVRFYLHPFAKFEISDIQACTCSFHYTVAR